MKAIICGPDEIPVRADFHQDFIDYLVGGALSEDGIQYSPEVTTGDAGVDVEVLTKVVDLGIEGDILWVEFVLCSEFKAVSSATADLIWQWQARNKGGTWVDLHPAVTETDVGTTYKERVRSGYFKPETSFNRVPFGLRLLLQCEDADEGRGRVKSSSFARAVYKVV
ncbi:hypothetical protein ES703_78599 [subsurface metagenome]